MAAKKAYAHLQQKTVKFGGKDLLMYSIDGITWSTRPDELQAIVERHNQEKSMCSSDLKGEEREEGTKQAPVRAAKRLVPAGVKEDEGDDEIELVDAELDEELPVEDVDIEQEDDDEDTTPKKKGAKPLPVTVAKPQKAPIMLAKKPNAKAKAAKLPAKKESKHKSAPKKATPSPKKRPATHNKAKKSSAKSGKRKAA